MSSIHPTARPALQIELQIDAALSALAAALRVVIFVAEACDESAISDSATRQLVAVQLKRRARDGATDAFEGPA